MLLSQLAEEIQDPPTLKLSQKARALKAEGEAVIHLGSGEPFARAPQAAIDKCKALLETGEIRYTATEGIPQLRSAIVRYTKQYYHREISTSNVIVCNGAKHALYTLMMAIVNPGEEVIITAPYWVSYPELVKMAYGKPIIIPPQGKQFLPTIDSIESHITPATRALIVNSPNNPSGALYPDSLIREFVELCERHDIFLVMDDIYHRLVFDSKIPASCLALTDRPLEQSKLVVINGVSKLYGMTGFRIGWAVANSHVVAGMATIAAQTVSCASVLTQTAALGALEGSQESAESLRLTLERNRNIMIRELSSLQKVRLISPSGTFYCLPDFSEYDANSERLSEFLLEKALVVTIPGKEFGIEGHLRLSYCGSESEIIEGVGRIRWALDSSVPPEMKLGNKFVRRHW